MSSVLSIPLLATKQQNSIHGPPPGRNSRQRSQLKPTQLKALNEICLSEPSPTIHRKRQIAAEIGASQRSVCAWFLQKEKSLKRLRSIRQQPLCFNSSVSKTVASPTNNDDISIVPYYSNINLSLFTEVYGGSALSLRRHIQKSPYLMKQPCSPSYTTSPPFEKNGTPTNMSTAPESDESPLSILALVSSQLESNDDTHQGKLISKYNEHMSPLQYKSGKKLPTHLDYINNNSVSSLADADVEKFLNLFSDVQQPSMQQTPSPPKQSLLETFQLDFTTLTPLQHVRNPSSASEDIEGFLSDFLTYLPSSTLV